MKKSEEAASEFFKSNTRWSERLMSLRRVVEEIGGMLPPEDDWMPVVIIDGSIPKTGPLPKGFEDKKRGEKGRFIFGIGDFMGSDDGKNILAQLMRAAGMALRAETMTFISCVWASISPGIKIDQGNLSDEEFAEADAMRYRKEHGTPSQDPNRIEKLMMMSVSYGGEDDGPKTAFASIKRYKDKPPALYDWVINDGEESGFIGRFPEAIYDALKMSQELRAREANEGET